MLQEKHKIITVIYLWG